MAILPINDSSTIAPVQFLLASKEPGVLAVITGIEGPSYRPLGAMMAISKDQSRAGTLSSGCVESDIALHAAEALEKGAVSVLKYGRGSPFVDIQLPCGGGLEVTLIPTPAQNVLAELLAAHQNRRAVSLVIDLDVGSIRLDQARATGRYDRDFAIRFDPEIFFYVFGKGPEAATFSALVESAGFPNVLCSPDEETLVAAKERGQVTRHLKSAIFPADLTPDARSAVVLFFHDHEWEPPILASACESDAFYIGAQGSQRAAEARRMELEVIGLSQDNLARVHGPIGLIPSARDARKLAVSVLADVMDCADR